MGFQPKPRNNRLTAYHVLGLLALALVLVAPIWLYGIPSGNDRHQHYQFAIAYRDGLASGTPVLGWSATVNEGFGDVGVRFYPPLSYWLLASAQIVTRNWFAASVLGFAFWFFLSGVGMYFWASEWFSKNAAFLGAALYMGAPYHANQLYNAFTYAEFAAAGVLPFCFLFATRVIERGGWSNVAGLAVSYCCLLLVHIPIAVLGSIGLGIYLAASLRANLLGFATLRSVIAIALGLAASSFYWLRVAIELPLVKHSTPEYSSGLYDFHANFLGSIFYLSAQDYSSRSLWFGDMVLLITLAVFVPGIAITFFSRNRKDLTKLLGVACLGGFALFISTPLSLPLWEHARLLQMIQFPWRALALISLCAAMLTAAGYEQIVAAYTTRKRPVSILATGLILAFATFTAAQIIRQAVFEDWDIFLERTSALASAKSYECWWPIWANDAALENRRITSTPDRMVFTTTTSGNGTRSFHLDNGQHGTVRIPIFYYPHWKATINDQPTPVRPDETGAILIDVPDGPAAIELSFQEPNYVIAAGFISAIAWVILIVLSIFGKSNVSVTRVRI